MYDSPKAAHFIAMQDGHELTWNDEAGLRVRWAAAHAFKDHGIHDMMHAELRLAKVAEILSIVNDGLTDGLEVKIDFDTAAFIHQREGA